jgi:hypothetical protein
MPSAVIGATYALPINVSAPDPRDRSNRGSWACSSLLTTTSVTLVLASTAHGAQVNAISERGRRHVGWGGSYDDLDGVVKRTVADRVAVCTAVLQCSRKSAHFAHLGRHCTIGVIVVRWARPGLATISADQSGGLVPRRLQHSGAVRSKILAVFV